MNFSVLIFSFVLSVIFHFLIQKIFIHYNRFDRFKKRSSHSVLATRTGGIGVFLTLLLVSVFFYFQEIELFNYSLFIPLSIMFFIGFYDDLYNADFKLKFFLQIIVAKILIDQGYVISNYYGLFGLYQVPWLIAQLSTVFVFLVVINSINFIDGIDGLAISQIIKSILIIEIVSLNLTELSTLSFIVISSIIPLYYFNFKRKRKIFLGDSGSMFLGTLIMIYILYVLNSDYQLENDININKVLFSIGALLYPLIDLLRIFIIRVSTGKSPFLPDNNHLHHKLLRFYNGNHFKTLISIMILELIIIVLIAKFLIN